MTHVAIVRARRYIPPATHYDVTDEGGWYGHATYGDQTQLFTVMLVPQYTTHAAGFGGLDPVG